MIAHHQLLVVEHQIRTQDDMWLYTVIFLLRSMELAMENDNKGEIVVHHHGLLLVGRRIRMQNVVV